MKPFRSIKYYCLHLIFYCTAFLSVTAVKAQLCTNNKDSIYGLTTTGQIVAINVINGGGTTIGSPATGAVNSNAAGFSPVTGLFYFFNKNGGAPQQFVSFNPNSGTVTALPASPIPPAYTVRSGAVNNLGTSYYTLDSSMVPSMHSNLFRYDITLMTWTTITSNIVDPSNVHISDLDSLVSGDMAFDGSNNLWLIAASKWTYALYEIKAPVPTSPVAKLTAQIIIPRTANPGASYSKVSFTGIAFNSLGHMYLCQGNNAAGNQIFEMISPPTLTLIAPITADYGADLTSCSFPTSVLNEVWIDFNAVFNNNLIKLDWKANEMDVVSNYKIEFSKDGQHWETIKQVAPVSSSASIQNKYSYELGSFTSTGFYRIVQVSMSGKESVSQIKFVNTNSGRRIFIGPNPAKDILYIYNRNSTAKYLAQIFDEYGKLIHSTTILPEQNSVDVSFLRKGIYVLKLSSSCSKSSDAHTFIKW